MPANLPPQYFEIEKKLRTAKHAVEKISIMEELLSIIPKHKGTEKLQAVYKTKIAKLKSQTQKTAAAARRTASFYIDKAGAGQVVLIGPPNSGKSSLIRALTNAEPDVGDYPFTTHTAAPAMMPYENIQIQLIDTPPITPEYLEFWQVEIIKNGDGTLILVDLANPDAALDFLALLEKLREKRIEFSFDEANLSPENTAFQKKALIVANKIDLPQSESALSDLKEVINPGFDPITISALNQDNLDTLRERIFEFLEILRVYSKTPGKKPSLDEPFVFKQGCTLMDMAKAVHKDFAQQLRFARIWGKGKYQGQKVNRDYTLQDEDIIELHI
jgi:small GTP-binding protein